MNKNKQHNKIDMHRLREAEDIIENTSPRGGRLIIWSILIFIIFVLIWTSIAEIDEVTRGEGTVIPSRQIQVIQNLEGGIISEILVREGDVVDAGQILIKLDNTQFAAALREGVAHCMEHRAKAARLKAEASLEEFIPPQVVLEKHPQFVQREYQLYLARKGQFKRQEKSLVKELKMMRPLVKEGAVSEIEILRLQESNQALRDKFNRTEITAPLKGVIKQVMVNTIGGVIKPGMDVLEIVPLDDSLLIEARITPADIAFIHPGQEVMVKITAYDFSIYGGLTGKIENIGADTISDDNNLSYYKIRVRTNKSKFGSEGNPLPIIPGMSARVDILTGKKTILHYLLKPVFRAKEKAFRER